MVSISVDVVVNITFGIIYIILALVMIWQAHKMQEEMRREPEIQADTGRC